MPDAFGFTMATGVLVAALVIFGAVSRVIAGEATELRCSFGAAVASGLRAWSHDPAIDDASRERAADATGNGAGPDDDGDAGEPEAPAVQVPVTHVAAPGLLPWHSVLGRQPVPVPIPA